MICICCKRSFEIKMRHGGQNRLICYECMPSNLTKKEKDNTRKRCLRIASESQKESMGCVKCGYSTFGAALDWHHTDPGNKDKAPAKALQLSWSAYLKEVEKCILLCSNCHREYHHRERTEGISLSEFL